MMSEDIKQLLKNLRLRKIAEIIEAELEAARKNSPSYTDFLARLLRAEWLDQQQKRGATPVKQGRIPGVLALGAFPVQNQPGGLRRPIPQLSGIEVFPQAEDSVP